MRRLAVAAVTVLAIAAGAVLLLPAGGSEAQPTGIELSSEQPQPLLAPQLLGMLQLLGPGRTPGRLGSERHPNRVMESIPSPCLRDGPYGPCVRVCTQFVASRECDRFPSATDGCLRFVRPHRSRCLDAPAIAQPTLLPARP